MEEVAPHTEGGEWVFRSYRKADNAAIVALFNAARRADLIDEVMSEAELLLAISGTKEAVEKLVFVVVPAGGGSICGYGAVKPVEDEERSERSYRMRLVVHPQARGRGLEEAIAGRLIDMANNLEREAPRKMNRSAVGAMVHEQDSARETWEKAGLGVVRRFHTLYRSLLEPVDEPQAIDGITVRRYRAPEDNDRARLAYNDSFSDHWNFQPDSPEEWEQGINSALCKPQLSLLAEVDAEPGKIAGFCIIWVFEEENRVNNRRDGWIDLLGTTREWRRRGLGRALLLEGLHSLREAGYDTALLGVDSESLTGADRLYASVGFRLKGRELILDCDLDKVIRPNG
jgi:mycothiol synthase